MVLKQQRGDCNDVLIIDASKGFEKIGKNNKLRSSDIKRIVDTVSARKNVDKFSRTVSREEIRKNDYNLNIPRYLPRMLKAGIFMRLYSVEFLPKSLMDFRLIGMLFRT